LSQYHYPPPPYSPPIVDPSAWAHAAPFPEYRAAAVWQFIFGSLIFLFGTCVGVLVAMPDDVLNMIAQQPQIKLQHIADFSPAQEIRLIFAISAGLILVVGALLVLLAVFVRKGGRASTISSIVLNCLVAFFMLISLPNELLQAAANPMAIISLLISLGIMGLGITTIAKLGIAIKSAGSAQSIAQQQAYYWMMQQQAQTYGQAGYSYHGGYPPPPNPPQNPPQNALPPENPNPPAPDQPPIPSDREK
jgi:hypothetical protein